jgi:hypothetical protein
LAGCVVLVASSVLLPGRAFAQLGNAMTSLTLNGSVTSTVLEDNGATTNAGDAGNTTPNSNQDAYDGTLNHPGVLTTGGGASGTGFDFSSSLSSLAQISSISITLTMLNGSSATAAQEVAGGDTGETIDDYDVNHLVLYLGGTYSQANGLTGGTEVIQSNGNPLYLNGFLTNYAQSTLTFSNILLDGPTGTAIASALSTGGGRLTAYVGSDNPNDTSVVQGLAGTGYGPAEIFLGNLPVPEPGIVTWLLAGGLLLLGWRARSRRSRSV